jgi:hypothetical protein
MRGGAVCSSQVPGVILIWGQVLEHAAGGSGRGVSHRGNKRGRLPAFCEALERTRTVDPLLTMIPQAAACSSNRLHETR